MDRKLIAQQTKMESEAVGHTRALEVAIALWLGQSYRRTGLELTSRKGWKCSRGDYYAASYSSTGPEKGTIYGD